jgi:putative membrane protein
MLTRRTFSVLILGSALIVACASNAEQDTSSSAAASVSDAEIAAIVVAANAIDAEAGDLAASHGTDPAVREFGKTMATDHRAVNEQAGALVARLGITPVESDVSRKLRADASAFQVELRAKSGAEFDRAYIEHEVAYHQAVIEALDKLLIPSAVNEELKQTLIAVRPAFLAHLSHAEQIQSALR